MRCSAGIFALLVCAAQVWAQARRPKLPAAQVPQLEAALKANPNDRAARRALLAYYYNARVDPAAAVPARRRLILWLIENAPGDELAGGPLATIDLAGHSLADPAGFELASDAWRAQAAKPHVTAATLTNAAYFFKLYDKQFTIRLLKRALGLEPASKEIGARLGDEYALAIMGITMINQNGFPLRADPNQTRSPVAREALDALETSRNPYVLAKAGYMLSFQGAILRATGKLDFDTAPMAEKSLKRAVSLAPGDADVANYLHQHYAIQEEVHKAARERNASSGPFAQTVAVRTVPPAHPPSMPQVTTEGLKAITVGMKRDQLRKLGTPGGRVTMFEDDHLTEVYQYFANNTRIGEIRLTDGIVSNVHIP